MNKEKKSHSSNFWSSMGYPVLISQADIADRNNVSRGAVSNWIKRYDFFPKEVMRVSRGEIPLYMLEEVEIFESKKAMLTREGRDPVTGHFLPKDK